MTGRATHCWRIVHSEASTGWGGQERRIMAELQGFRRRGHDVWLIASPQSRIYQAARTDGIACVAADFARWKHPAEIVRLAAWLRRIRPHVVNPHSSRDGWVVGAAARLARAPLIIRTRHIDVDYPNKFISRHAYTTLADHVLTTSSRITRHFQEMFALPDDRITTLPTGIDLNLFSPDGARATLDTGADFTPLVGMVSVLRSWKGHATFLDAAAKLNASGFRARYVIVGDGPQQGNIQEMIARLGLAEVTTLTGNRDDVPEILRTLSVLVIPSTKHEGVPQIGLQALAVKTPVVGSDVGGIPEIIRPGETGRIFPGGDAAVLAQALRETFEDAAATRRMCEAGRVLVEKEHSLEGMLDKTEALYRHHLRA
jgi:glycosyltransferase involved in cell wall biosynthesis